jgi:hypothetical protein
MVAFRFLPCPFALLFSLLVGPVSVSTRSHSNQNMNSENEYDIPSSPPTPSLRKSPTPTSSSPSQGPSRSSPSHEGPAPTPPGSPTRNLSNGSNEHTDFALSTQGGRASGHKRPARDMSQFAEFAARNVKLKSSGRESLLQFAKVTQSGFELILKHSCADSGSAARVT